MKRKKIGIIGSAALSMAALMAFPIMPIINTNTQVQQERVTQDKKEVKAVPNQKKDLYRNRYLAPKPFIVLNQRQKRKRWRQCPHTRPTR